ncbi:hypothetical protein ACFV2H_49420 [Streptomyces sp. NPDC059629]|uniref:hypothetical protein n=1 Tax=Streptomyces sp. NPDC059629 TaxID=3346889 RepID=UPI003679C6E5
MEFARGACDTQRSVAQQRLRRLIEVAQKIVIARQADQLIERVLLGDDIEQLVGELGQGGHAMPPVLQRFLS